MLAYLALALISLFTWLHDTSNLASLFGFVALLILSLIYLRPPRIPVSMERKWDVAIGVYVAVFLVAYLPTSIALIYLVFRQQLLIDAIIMTAAPLAFFIIFLIMIVLTYIKYGACH